MSIHFIKLIELLSIDQVQDKNYLHIVVYANEAFELYWDVDLETATNLQHVCEFDGNHKYRLSLKTVSDTSSNLKITSHITKTYLNNSARTDFFTTEAFRQQVELIRQSGSAATIRQLPFLLTPEQFTHLKERAIDELRVNEEELQSQQELPALPHLDTPETIELTKMEIEALMEPLPSENAEVAVSKADTSAETFSETSLEVPLEATQHTEQSIARLNTSPRTKWLATASLALLVVIGIYFLIGSTKLPEKTTASEQSTYENFEIEEPFIFKLPANHVALTFDKGPSIYTQDIMDILKSYNIGATFFVLGSNLNTFPLTVERMHKEGYAIGHTTTHYSLLTDMPYDKIEAEWLYTAQKIEAITGNKVELFRPPYGLFNKNTLAVADAYDFHLVTWSLNPFESKATTIETFLQSNELSGAIISMTESQETVDALPTIVDTLLENKLKIVQLN